MSNRARLSLAPISLLGLCLFCVFVAGCFQAPNEAEVVEQDPFEYGRLRALPDIESLVNQVKPGHWIAAHQQMTAVNEFQGSIESRVLDNANRPIATEMATHTMIDVRPIVLASKEAKDVELQFYIPRRLDRESQTVTLENRLFDRTGRLADTQGGSVSLMPDYRFFGVALTSTPSRYAYLNSLLTNRIDDGLDVVQFTHVVVPKVEPFVPLPSDVFGWTSLSWILWDDLDPERLEPAQRQAMIDWLHFGGQLLVSGPDALDRLRGSFLEPFLAAKTSATKPIDLNSIELLSRAWSPSSEDKGRVTQWEVSELTVPLGVDLVLSTNSRWLPSCSGLVADRPIGRGRVVVTAFSLTERSFLSWPGLDCFYHNVLLLKPRRNFDNQSLQPLATRVRFVDSPGEERNPLNGSTLRFFTRDWGTPLGIRPANESTEESPVEESSLLLVSERSKEPSASWRVGPYDTAAQSGVAGWNDMSAVAFAARRTLDASTGIEPPAVGFVATSLAIYLVVLVPLNWLVFRIVRRVEWAWIAAPIIAIVAAVIIVRLANLDIGFARSQTELAIIEFPAEYSRAHVTRFSTVYSSLSTRFDVEFEAGVSRAQPWGNPDVQMSQVGVEPKEVRLRRVGALELEGFDVVSNSAELMHSEAIVDFPGQFAWRLIPEATSSINGVLTNRSGLNLEASFVITRSNDGSWYGKRLGAFSDQSEVAVTLEPIQNLLELHELCDGDSLTRLPRSRATERFKALDADTNGFLTLLELRSDSVNRSDWLRRFQSLAIEKEIDERVGMNLEVWLDESQSIVDSELSAARVLDLWLEQQVQEGVGTYLIGVIDKVPETEIWNPRPSQVRRLGMVVAALTPFELPEPQCDLVLPAISPLFLDEEEDDEEMVEEAGDALNPDELKSR